jgi:hypothetical protein
MAALIPSYPIKLISFVADVLLLCAVLAFALRPAMSSTPTISAPSITVTDQGSLNITSAPGQDILLDAVSVSSLNTTLSNLVAENSAIKVENSAIKASVSVLSTSNAQLSSLLQGLLADPWHYLSTCAISQSPQQLAKAYETFATFTSADGSLYLIAQQDTSSALYKHDGYGSFVSQQTLWSAFDTAKTLAFKVGAAQFVALAFYDQGTTRDYRCELFVFNEATKLLVSVQNISTTGVTGVSSTTTSDGVTFLALSNHRDKNGSYNIPSYIMRFNNQSQQFEHYQNISTIGAYPPEFFQVGTDTFLAIPLRYDGSTYLQQSVIYVLNVTTGWFSLNQSIPTYGGHHLVPWSRNSNQFLSIISSQGMYIDVFIYNTTQGQFVNISSGVRLFSFSPQGAHVVTIADSLYMAVAPWGTDARIYKWNDELTAFDQLQELELYPFDWYFPHFFTVGVDTFLALSDRIYKFCGGQFNSV